MHEVDWKELNINLSWGTMRGKTCVLGSLNKNLKKFVCIHGWLDNANSFDELVPHLPEGSEVLSIDLPGHGLSDHLPQSAHYDILTFVIALKSVLEEVKWNR